MTRIAAIDGRSACTFAIEPRPFGARKLADTLRLIMLMMPARQKAEADLRPLPRARDPKSAGRRARPGRAAAIGADDNGANLKAKSGWPCASVGSAEPPHRRPREAAAPRQATGATVVDAFEDAEVARRVVPPSELPVVRFGIEKQAFLSNSDRFQDRGAGHFPNYGAHPDHGGGRLWLKLMQG